MAVQGCYRSQWRSWDIVSRTLTIHTHTRRRHENKESSKKREEKKGREMKKRGSYETPWNFSSVELSKLEE